MSHIPQPINPLQWHQAMGYARQACARIFRDGGGPRDALQAFGLRPPSTAVDWSKAVELVARELCSQPVRQAA